MLLSYKEFQDYLVVHLQERTPREMGRISVSLSTKPKINDDDAVCLLVSQEESKYGMMIQLQNYYRDYLEGTCMDEIIKMIIHALKSLPALCDLEGIYDTVSDFDNIHDHIIPVLVNATMNKDVLKQWPHTYLDDMAVIYKIYFGNDENGISSIDVTSELKDIWQVGIDVIHECAIENARKLLPVKVHDLLDVAFIPPDNMFFMQGSKVTTSLKLPRNRMFIVTNNLNMWGASAIMYSDVLENMSGVFNCGLYILPSSIHEVIVVPETLMDDTECMKEIVRSANKECVSFEDQLSNNVYYYNRITKQISKV